MFFKTFEDIADYLDGLGMFHMDMGLNRMHKALQNLNLTTLPYPAIQIVGTNGKGSTSTFLSNLATTHNLNTGLYTSPHLLNITERIKINNLALPGSEWPKLANIVHQACSKLTYFEFLTVLSALAFAKAKVDLAIFEAGLGGKSDATTALGCKFLVITPIAMDHEKIIGPSLADIAKDKAAAMTFNTRVITSRQDQQVFRIVQQQANNCSCHLIHVADHAISTKLNFDKLKLSGLHQQENAKLALTAWHELANIYGFAQGKEAQALAKAFIPGRFQKICLSAEKQKTLSLPKKFILDGSHNAHGLEALQQNLQFCGYKCGALIFNCMQDKDQTPMLNLIQNIAAGKQIFIPSLNNSRAEQAPLLATKLNGTAMENMFTSLNACAKISLAEDEYVIICGSLYMLGDFYALYPKFLEGETD